MKEEKKKILEFLMPVKPGQIKDSIGDVIVVLTVFSLQLGLDIEKCTELAYEKIKDRKGKMVNGVFVKESDL